MLVNFPDDEIPDGELYGYHKKCYQEYTNKQKLKRISEKLIEGKLRKEEERRSSRKSGSSS